MTPEECAFLDSALEAEARLKALNILRLTDGRELHRHVESLSGDIQERLRKKAIGVMISEELALAPWALTRNFDDMRRGRCLLALAGIGDPTGVGAGHSYTRLSLREAGGGSGAAAAPQARSAPRRRPPRRTASAMCAR